MASSEMTPEEAAAARETGARVAQARRQKAVRERRDITQREVAREVGVSATTISECESGKQPASERVLLLLAAYLGVTPAFLRYGITEPVVPPASPAPVPAQIPEHERVRTYQGVGRIVAGRGAPAPQDATTKEATTIPLKKKGNA